MTQTELANPAQALQRIESGPPNTAVALLDVISRAAKDSSVDVEKMERLMAMHERVMAREAEMAFNGAMELAQAEMPIVPKEGQNTQTNSKFVKLETLYKRCVPITTKHGFSISYGTTDCPLPGYYRITARVRHRSGHSEPYQADVPSDHLGPKGLPNKTLTHGFGSSMTYGRRYLFMLIFNVNTGDDNDGNNGEAEESVTALQKKLWELLQPIRGTVSNWTAARQWLETQNLIEKGRKVTDLKAAELASVIDKAGIVLTEMGFYDPKR